jgi:hypothetical protein
MEQYHKSEVEEGTFQEPVKIRKKAAGAEKFETEATRS